MNNAEYAKKIVDALRHEATSDITRPFSTTVPVARLEELANQIDDEITPAVRCDLDPTVSAEGLELAGSVHSSILFNWELSADGMRWVRAK
jgi:hypothetical protein